MTIKIWLAIYVKSIFLKPFLMIYYYCVRHFKLFQVFTPFLLVLRQIVYDSTIFTTFIPLSKELKNSISELLKESSQFNVNDVLVHAEAENAKLFLVQDSLHFDLADFPKSILKEAEKTRKESGVNSLCLAEGIVHILMNGKEVQTPVLLTPLIVVVNKLQKTVKFQPQIEEAFVNPFLSIHLEKGDLDISNSHAELDEEDSLLDKLVKKLTEAGLATDQSTTLIGNFHHHRYQVIKELEELLELDAFAPHIETLFGHSHEAEEIHLNLPPDILFPSDTDHEKVFEKVQANNLVVQGPPGTGKSQVLSNVVAKILAAGKTSIFVSEKRVALEVIQKKLRAFDLDKLCFIATSDNLSHSFLQELKTTWDYFENYEVKPINNLRLSEQYRDNLQMTLDLLAQDTLIGGISFHHFQEVSHEKQIERYPYNSQVPSINDFLEQQSTLRFIYANKLNVAVGHLKKALLQREDFIRLDTHLAKWETQIDELSDYFDLITWSDFKTVMKQAADCQIYENDLYKKYADIFRPNGRPQKRFLNLRKKYLQARVELERINSNQSHWKIVPSESETSSLLNTLETGGFISKRKTNKRWKEISHLPISDAKKELEHHLEEIDNINSFSQIIIKFCELGIDNPETEVDLIYQTIGLFSEDQWNELETIPGEKRVKLTTYHTELNALYHNLKNVFRFDEKTEVAVYISELQQQLASIVERHKQIQALDDLTLQSIGRNLSFESLEGELLNSHWVRFKERFPAFSQFSLNDIHTKVKTIIQAEKTEANLFAQEIENKQHATFVEYHALLNTPARKLSDEQKALKVQLRKGKSILVKEFGKTRSHPSLRELYNSEARKWIQLLKPIWLSNPTQLAKCFPMESALFDVAIFDEASQIPLQNALGTLQRSTRVLIAGDEHQMGPSSYFKSGSSEVIDLLHQANYHWKKVSLQHHYRSVHPDLIAFSNKHFYDGLLKAYPACNAEPPLRHHFIAHGAFINRQNEIEAKALVTELEKALTEKNTIGVVAFSEEQLNCIWSNLSTKGQQLLTEHLENNRGFFKALENVQGDECDRLFVSFGYGKNEEGDFHMRFGPMNTTNGRKRLNVLLTRAIKSIDFFCSIQSSDFKLSDNESINLLRQWIAFSEKYSTSETLDFPFSLNPVIKENTLVFERIQETLPLAAELVTLERVLENRGWVVSYA